MLGSTAAKRLSSWEFYASTGTARFYNDESRANEAPALPASGGILARGVRGHHVCPLNCHAQLRFEVENGFSREQQLNNSVFFLLSDLWNQKCFWCAFA